jgi:hypothetical protein
MSNRKWVPTWAAWYTIEHIFDEKWHIEITFYGTGPNPSNVRPIAQLAQELGINDVCQQIRDKPLSERMKPQGKYDREIKPNVWVDVYDVLAAFTGRVSDKCKPAVDHAIKKLLAPGLRGAKEERQDLVEARDSIDRAIQQLDEWA